MSAPLNQGSSPQDDKAGSKYKENETSESFLPHLIIGGAGRKFPCYCKGIIAGVVILAVVVIIIIVVTVTSSSLSSMKKGLTVVPWKEINFDPHVPSSYEDEVSALNSFMIRYNESKLGGKMVLCDDDEPVPDGKLCYFKRNWIYSICPPHLDWNYGNMHPCVLLTLREVTESIQVYDTYDELPESMPSGLKDVILSSYKENNDKMPKNIWVSCTNEERYTSPAQGFPAYYLPHHDDPDYLPPLVGVVLNLEGKANIKEEIECKLWAKNIAHETDDFATVKFTAQIKGA